MPCLLHKEKPRLDGTVEKRKWLEMLHVWLISEVLGLSSRFLPLLRSHWPSGPLPLWLQLIAPEWTLNTRPYDHCLVSDQSTFENLHCKR